MASYSGNLGMVEMFKFYQVATDVQKEQMKEFITTKNIRKAWDFLHLVIGVKLDPIEMSGSVKENFEIIREMNEMFRRYEMTHGIIK